MISKAVEDNTENNRLIIMLQLSPLFVQ